jgi:hypothetical protein
MSANKTPEPPQTPAALIRCTDWLGKSGFIFLDDQPWPFAVKEYHCGWWLHRWSDRIKGFITYRAISADEAERLRARAHPAILHGS